MKTGVYQLFLTCSLSALLLASPAVADETSTETEAPVIETVPETVEAEPELPSPEQNLIAATQRVKDVFEARSRQVLAASGDRSTAKARQSLSIWLAALADDLDDGLMELAKASAAFDLAKTREDVALAKAQSDLLARLEAARADVHSREENNLPPILQPVLDEIMEELETLQGKASDLESTRAIEIDLTFAEGLTDEDRLLFTERLSEFQSATGVVLTEEPGGFATGIWLEGRAPASMTVLQLKTALASIWTPPVPTAEDEEDAPLIVDLPDPSFVGITLN